MKTCSGIFDMNDKAINNLISYLKNKIDFEKIQVIDYWEADNCAIGFTNENNDKLIYVSSFQKKSNQFHVELEYKSDLKANEIFENLSRDEIQKILNCFYK